MAYSSNVAYFRCRTEGWRYITEGKDKEIRELGKKNKISLFPLLTHHSLLITGHYKSLWYNEKSRHFMTKEYIMALTQQRKQELISEYQVHDTDTGSTEVQIAMLTERISRLSEHLRSNQKDHSSRRGLLKLIGQRKRLLSFLQSEDKQKYQNLLARLGIRG